VSFIALSRWRRSTRGFPLFSDEDFSVFAFHRPARDVVERRRPNRSTGAKIEARVVPWAANGGPDEKTFCQRPTVVRAMCGDGENLIAMSGEHQRLSLRVSE